MPLAHGAQRRLSRPGSRRRSRTGIPVRAHIVSSLLHHRCCSPPITARPRRAVPVHDRCWRPRRRSSSTSPARWRRSGCSRPSADRRSRRRWRSIAALGAIYSAVDALRRRRSRRLSWGAVLLIAGGSRSTPLMRWHAAPARRRRRPSRVSGISRLSFVREAPQADLAPPERPRPVVGRGHALLDAADQRGVLGVDPPVDPPVEIARRLHLAALVRDSA